MGTTTYPQQPRPAGLSTFTLKGSKNLSGRFHVSPLLDLSDLIDETFQLSSEVYIRADELQEWDFLFGFTFVGNPKFEFSERPLRAGLSDADVMSEKHIKVDVTISRAANIGADLFVFKGSLTPD